YLNMALDIRAIGVDKVKDLEYFQPSNPDLRIDSAIDTSLLSKDILDLYRAFRTPFRFTPHQLAEGFRDPKMVARVDSAATARSVVNQSPSAVDLSQRREDIGSN